MNSTVNYGYETQISAVSAIDRDLKRVEDKADAALKMKEQIIRNEEKLRCHSKHKCNAYTKCETDRLLDIKVDKQDGYDLISNDCLRQIINNKDGISLLHEYIKELQEQNIQLRKELDGKINGQFTVNAYYEGSAFYPNTGETLEELVERMPNLCIYYFGTANGDRPLLMPEGVGGGMLMILKHGLHRCYLEFCKYDSAELWRGNYYNNREAGRRFNGWNKVAFA